MNKTILVADDSKTIRHVVNLTFYATGYRVVAASSAKEAVDRIKDERPDLLLADVGMPGVDGYQLCEQVKADARYGHIPVLLMTGAFEPFDERRAQAARADGHIKKPFDSQTLLDHVKRLTGERVEAQAPMSFAESLAAKNAPNGGNAPARATRPDVDDLMSAPSAQRGSPFGAPRAEAAPAPAPAPVAPPVREAPRPAPAPVPQAPPAPTAIRARADSGGFEVDEDVEDEPMVAGGGFGGPSLEPPPAPTAAELAERRAVDMWSLSDENARRDDHAEPVEEIEIDDVPASELKKAAPVVARAAAPAVAEAAQQVVPGLPRDELLRIAKETIERIAWEVVPELAETIIREELRRLLRDR